MILLNHVKGHVYLSLKCIKLRTWCIKIDFGLNRIKVVAADFLAFLGGNTDPYAEDLKTILGSGMLVVIWKLNGWLIMLFRHT